MAWTFRGYWVSSAVLGSSGIGVSGREKRLTMYSLLAILAFRSSSFILRRRRPIFRWTEETMDESPQCPRDAVESLFNRTGSDSAVAADAGQCRGDSAGREVAGAVCPLLEWGDG